jgi:hypothetical protein
MFEDHFKRRTPGIFEVSCLPYNGATSVGKPQREPRMLAGVFRSGMCEIVGLGLSIWVAIAHGISSGISSRNIAFSLNS